MIRTILTAGVASLAIVASHPALAAEIEANSVIDAVTVFPDAAIVTRKLEVNLPPGASTLVLKSLPATIDPASLRVEGQASGRLLLGAVESRLQPADPQKIVGEKEQEMKGLREQLAQINATLNALEGKKAMIARYAEAGPARDDKSGALDVAQWGAAWSAVGDALARVNMELLAAQKQKQETEQRLRAIEISEQGRRARLVPNREFVVAVEAETAVKGALTISYRVINAGWQPTYDARLDTDGKTAATLLLARRALVTQRTGEDWSNVEVTLSTVRTARGTAAPTVDPQRVGFFEPPMPAVAYVPAPTTRPRAADNARAAAPAQEDSERSLGAARQKAEAPQAVMDAGGYQATYRLPGRITVPTDGSQKSLIVQSRELKPELIVKASPALDPTAYLEAVFANDEEAPLLAGTVNLIRDNMFVGRGQLSFTPPGEKVSLGFGADDRVKVARVPLRRRETEPALLGSTKSDTRDFKITVKNLHDFVVKTTIIDQIPFSEAANLTVEPLPTNTPATEKSVQDKRGVMGWTYDLKPKEEREIRLGYRMRWPSDREITMQRAPNTPAN